MNNTISIKRFEIVIGIEQFEQIIELLERCGARRYTVIKNVGGYGTRGVRNPHDVLIPDENVLIILACTDEQAQEIVDELSPVKKKFGGICLITNCQRIVEPTGL